MYILVTPVKNEYISLPTVAYSILKQTIKPLLWVIVDDGSTDATPEIIRDLEKRYSWIRGVRLPPKERDITYHVAYVYKTGFDSAVAICKDEQIEYEFIASLDADSVPEQAYFEKLIDEIRAKPGIGIISGGVYQNINGKLEWRKTSRKLPTGTGRLWNKKCFFDTGGYTVEPAPDSISNVKALINGWETKQAKDAILIQTRLTSSAEGLWKGYKINGFFAYYLNKHPFLVALNAIYLAYNKPYYLFIPYVYGYLSSWVKREKKTDDESIRTYYWNTRIKEYRYTFMNRIKSPWLR